MSDPRPGSDDTLHGLAEIGSEHLKALLLLGRYLEGLRKDHEGLTEGHQEILDRLAAAIQAIEESAASQDRLATVIEERTRARQEVLSDFVATLKSRWVVLAVGLAAGLGLAGASEILRALVGAMLGGAGVP